MSVVIVHAQSCDGAISRSGHGNHRRSVAHPCGGVMSSVTGWCHVNPNPPEGYGWTRQSRHETNAGTALVTMGWDGRGSVTRRKGISDDARKCRRSNRQADCIRTRVNFADERAARRLGSGMEGKRILDAVGRYRVLTRGTASNLSYGFMVWYWAATSPGFGSTLVDDGRIRNLLNKLG